MKAGIVLVLAAALVGLMPGGATGGGATKRYVVVLAGTETADGFELAGTRAAVEGLVAAAGGTVTLDLSRQIGVLVVDSPNGLFAEAVRGSALVEEAAEDFKWKSVPTAAEAGIAGIPDPLEPLQWSMQQIRAPQAHAAQTGNPAVEVGILDTGIDGAHLDLVDNVDCAKGRDFVALGPGVGNPVPCVDNGFHGTHVAGIVAAADNEHGVVGVAPDVTVVPVKVCDSSGYCYSSSTVAGITYAGDAKLEVINMSFFVDDNELLESHEFKCMSDPQQRAFRKANERAIQYARNQGVVPVAALGNSDNDLADPPEPYENDCDVVPAETEGVIGTMSLGRQSQKASYSNYGSGAVDVAAPGGSGTTGDCTRTVLSTLPGNTWGCFQGTSMASPHAAGVAALIVSQFGRPESGDWVLSPTRVEQILQGTAIDIGLPGYDECFGNGRIDAVRAVAGDTSGAYDAAAPFCPEYEE